MEVAQARMDTTTIENLKAEARALARMILRRDVEPEFIDRYVQAHQHLMSGPQPLDQVSLVRFAIRHRLLLPSLDAAVAFVQPDAMLHKKALLMTAILEASPRYADEFLPRRRSAAGLALLLVRIGIETVLRLGVGVPILWIVRKRA